MAIFLSSIALSSTSLTPRLLKLLTPLTPQMQLTQAKRLWLLMHTSPPQAFSPVEDSAKSQKANPITRQK